MKFSAMTTREQAVLLCRIAPVVSRIGQDEEMNAKMAEMAKEDAEKKKTVLQKVSAMIDVFAPVLLDRHYDDAMIVCGALIGKTQEELDEMGILSIIREVKGVIDEELVSFFKQSDGTEATA